MLKKESGEKVMKTAIAYCSKAHGNTRKLLDEIAKNYKVTLIDVTQTKRFDLSGYGKIGFASGIYHKSFAEEVIAFAKKNLPKDKEVFLICTYGVPCAKRYDNIRKILEKKEAKEIGTYDCLGFDDFGAFGLVGGQAKGYPRQEELDGAVKFFEEL